MSALAIPPNSFQLTDTHIHIGEISIAFSSVTKYWLYRTSQIVQLCCRSAKGEGYKGNIALELPSVDKTKELFTKLLCKTTRAFKAPYMLSITPNSKSIQFEFSSLLGAETFFTYFAPLMVTEKDFKCSLSDRCVSFMNEESSDQTDRIRTILARLSEQISDQMIEKKLSENNDPNFPGKEISPKDGEASVYDFERPTEKSFEITRAGFKEICWTNSITKMTFPTKPHIINHWINQA